MFLGSLLREQAPVAIHEWNDTADRTFNDVKACLAMAKKKAVEAGLNVPVPGATDSTYMNP